MLLIIFFLAFLFLAFVVFGIIFYIGYNEAIKAGKKVKKLK
jgi:hypothetical protein